MYKIATGKFGLVPGRLSRNQRRMRAKHERCKATGAEAQDDELVHVRKDGQLSQNDSTAEKFLSMAKAEVHTVEQEAMSEQQISRSEQKRHFVTPAPSEPEGGFVAEDAARAGLPMEVNPGDGMQISYPVEISEARTDHHGRTTTAQGFPAITPTEQSSRSAGRARRNKRVRADQGKGHGFGMLGRGAKHIRFDDDGVSALVEHDVKLRRLPPDNKTATRGEVVLDELGVDEHENRLVDHVATVDTEAIPAQLKSKTYTFDTLPDDVFFAICDYLNNPLIAYKYHTRPQNAEDYDCMFKHNSSPSVLESLAFEHPYLRLSLTSRKLRDQVEAYCNHAAQQILSSIMPNAEARLKDKKIPHQKLAKEVVKAQRMEYKAKTLVDSDEMWRLKWLSLAWKRCGFCGKSTVRRAVFNYIVWCCRKCDNKQWPKIKRTEALANSTTLHPVHLDSPNLVLDDVKPPILAFEWATQQTYFLKDEIEILERRVRRDDPDMQRTMDAELEVAIGLKTFGGVRGLGGDAKRLMQLWGRPLPVPVTSH